MYTFLKSSHQAGSNHMKKPYCVFLPLIPGFAPEWLTSKEGHGKERRSHPHEERIIKGEPDGHIESHGPRDHVETGWLTVLRTCAETYQCVIKVCSLSRSSTVLYVLRQGSLDFNTVPIVTTSCRYRYVYCVHILLQ